MLDLDDDWVWDFWVVEDPASEPASYHLFFLKAPRSLGDPELRHFPLGPQALSGIAPSVGSAGICGGVASTPSSFATCSA